MSNTEIVQNFYSAFKQKDAKTMNSFLADNICFEDPAFGKLEGEDVKYMWQFLIENAKDFSMNYTIENEKNNTVSANWTAQYTFSTTGNTVINEVRSRFEIHDGKIINHKDDFDLKKWIKQALGSAAGFFGASFLVKNAVQKQSRALLKTYQKKNTLKQ